MTRIPHTPTKSASDLTILRAKDRQEKIRIGKQICEQWNDANEPGCKVVYRPVQGCDDGKFETTTVSDAHVTIDGEAVVFLACRMGSVSVLHCEVVR